MSYRLRARWGQNKWFDNAYDAVLCDSLDRWKQYRLFEREYGYQIGVDKFGFPICVWFPSEAEATMFVLRWS
jgi:hypothetical protein